MNNARYIEFLLDCYGEEHHRKQQISSLTVSFVAEAKYGDDIGFCMASDAHNGSRHFIEVRKAKSTIPVVQALLAWTPAQKSRPDKALALGH